MYDKKIIGFIKIFLLSCIFYSCGNENRYENEISKIPVAISIERFDQLFATLNKSNLQIIKKEYPFLFPERYSDNIWLERSKDTIQLEVNEEVSNNFSSLAEEEAQLISFFQHVIYYFPKIKVPRIITITSDVDYENKVILADSLLLISLDTYLGKEHHFYDGIQNFKKSSFVREQIVPDVASMYAKTVVPLPKDRTFLANLIYYGKELYLKKMFLPAFSKEDLIGYTAEEYRWGIANEEEVWRYFIDKQLLYSTDKNLASRFLYPAPFSKFNLVEIDGESPDKIGQFIGWRIVEAYMKNNNVSLQKLLEADAEIIFTKSKYKPKR